jgi:DNA-binding response OmpR family regulator
VFGIFLASKDHSALKFSRFAREKTRMAKVVLVGLEQATASQISRALGVELHQIEQTQHLATRELIEADVVFAGGEPSQYLNLLRMVRAERPSLPFVVVTRNPETEEWLNALEAGATDYCSGPFQSRQIHWLMEAALSSTNLRTTDTVLNQPQAFSQIS